jgi:hypothetical protein
MEAADRALQQLLSELEKEDIVKRAKDAKKRNKKQKQKTKTKAKQKEKTRKPRTRPLPGSKSSRRAAIFILPNDLWMVLLNLITEKDRICLALTSRSVYQKVWNLYLHEATHLCHAEIQREWNAMAEVCFASLRKNGTHQERGIVFCSVFPWRRHYLKVWYQHNTMDVDVLTWYIDDKMHAYTYL